MPQRSLSPAVVACAAGLALWASGVGESTTARQDREVHDDGFSVTQAYEIDAEPTVVYRTMVDGVGRYWHPDHTFSGDSANLYIDPRPGGCFCETLEDGGFVRHLDVVFVSPARLLRLEGGLGPLGEYAVSGVLSLGLEPSGEGTRLTLTYRVSGHVPEGFTNWVDPVSGVLRQQMERLRRLVETGSAGPR